MDDAELFQVNEDFVAFQREYKRGEKLRESDLANWCVAEKVQEAEIAKLLLRGAVESLAEKRLMVKREAAKATRKKAAKAAAVKAKTDPGDGVEKTSIEVPADGVMREHTFSDDPIIAADGQPFTFSDTPAAHDP